MPAAAASHEAPIVIHLGRLGDTVLAHTLLAALRGRYRQPSLLIGAKPWAADLYGDHPDVGAVHTLHRHTPWPLDPDGWRVWRALARSRHAPVYVCELEPRRLARVRRLLKWARVAPERCVFMADQPESSLRHWADRLAAFAAATPRVDGAPYRFESPPPREPRLKVSAAERADCAAWIASRGWTDRSLILFQPGNRRTMRSNWRRRARPDPKAWPAERWAQLLARVQAHRPEAVLVLCGSPQEIPMLERIRAASGLTRVGIASRGIRGLCALCERAEAMISVDTGPAHVAAALGTPLLVLFGAHSPQEWQPRAANGRVSCIGGPPLASVADLQVETVFRAWTALGAEPAAASRAAGG